MAGNLSNLTFSRHSVQYSREVMTSQNQIGEIMGLVGIFSKNKILFLLLFFNFIYTQVQQ